MSAEADAAARGRAGRQGRSDGFPSIRCLTIRRRNSTDSRSAPQKASGSTEPDTLVYVIHVVPKAPMQRIMYEIYRDRAAFESHERQPHIRRFMADLASCVLATNIIDLRLKYAKVAALGAGGQSGRGGQSGEPGRAGPPGRGGRSSPWPDAQPVSDREWPPEATRSAGHRPRRPVQQRRPVQREPVRRRQATATGSTATASPDERPVRRRAVRRRAGHGRPSRSTGPGSRPGGGPGGGRFTPAAEDRYTAAARTSTRPPHRPVRPGLRH